MIFFLFLSLAADLTWDHWYILENKTAIIGVYSEKFEIKDKTRLHYEQHLYQTENDRLIEEHIGSFSTLADLPVPETFDFRRLTESRPKPIEQKISGIHIKEKNKFSIKIYKDETQFETKDAPMNSKSMLLSNFPYYLSKLKLKPKEKKSFFVFAEDGLKLNRFEPVEGTVELKEPKKFLVSFSGLKQIWALDEDGQVETIQALENNTMVKRISKEKAQEILKLLRKEKPSS